jgi:hypothetical protein
MSEETRQDPAVWVLLPDDQEDLQYDMEPLVACLNSGAAAEHREADERVTRYVPENLLVHERMVKEEYLKSFNEEAEHRRVERARGDTIQKREAELHYAIRRDANILDHKLTETDAHAEALFRVAKMHDVVEAAHEVNRQMKATNGKVTMGAWAKLADALDMRVPAEAT